MNYIMIIMLLHNGTFTFDSVEFEDRDSCESAKSLVFDHMRPAIARDGDGRPWIACVPKGETSQAKALREAEDAAREIYNKVMPK